MAGGALACQSCRKADSGERVFVLPPHRSDACDSRLGDSEPEAPADAVRAALEDLGGRVFGPERPWCLCALPAGYRLSGSPAVVTGHPVGRAFSSSSDAARHFRYLYGLGSDDDQRGVLAAPCTCRLCNLAAQCATRKNRSGRQCATGSTFIPGETVWARWPLLLTADAGLRKEAAQLLPDALENWWPARIVKVGNAVKPVPQDAYATPTPSPTPASDSKSLGDAADACERYTVELLRWPSVWRPALGLGRHSSPADRVQVLLDQRELQLLPCSALYAEWAALAASNETSTKEETTDGIVAEVPLAKTRRSASLPHITLAPPKSAEKSLASVFRQFAAAAADAIPQIVRPLGKNTLLTDHVRDAHEAEMNQRMRDLLGRQGARTVRLVAGGRVPARRRASVASMETLPEWPATTADAGGRVESRVAFFDAVALGPELVHCGDIVRLRPDGLFVQKQTKGWLIDASRELDRILFQADAVVQHVVLLCPISRGPAPQLVRSTLRLLGRFCFVYRDDERLAGAAPEWHRGAVDVRDVEGRCYPSSDAIGLLAGRTPISSIEIVP